MPVLIEDAVVDLQREDLERRTPLVRPDSPTVRTPGIHLSGVLRYIIRTSRMPGWQRYEQELDETRIPLIWAFGIATEEFLVSLYREIAWQPGEAVMDGVSMTCDGMSFDPCQIEEFKWTSANVRTGVEFAGDWLKQSQGRGYCAGYGFNRVRWHVWYGREPWAPVYKRFVFEYSDKEIEDTRRMILANRDGALDGGYAE